jgi:peptidyl-prolyl cis-trans isomerase B (cyclophilin B)
MEAFAMRLPQNLAWASLAVAVLVAAGGCGKKSQADAETATAAVKGDAAQPASDAQTQPAVDRLHPVVVLDTSLGSITITLDAERAPITVGNFLAYVNRGHYDNTIFHRVNEGYVVIGGGFTPDLKEKPAELVVANEAYNHLKNRRGTIAMYRSPDIINSARSQFFFNVADNTRLDFKDRTVDGYGYCAFGEVTAGLEVVDRIAATKVEDRPKFEKIPAETVLIRSARQVR